MTVLTLVVYVFSCNTPGCQQDTGEITPPNPGDGARSAWRVAARTGWTRRGADKHFCPDHGAHDVVASQE